MEILENIRLIKRSCVLAVAKKILTRQKLFGKYELELTELMTMSPELPAVDKLIDNWSDSEVKVTGTEGQTVYRHCLVKDYTYSNAEDGSRQLNRLVLVSKKPELIDRSVPDYPLVTLRTKTEKLADVQAHAVEVKSDGSCSITLLGVTSVNASATGQLLRWQWQDIDLVVEDEAETVTWENVDWKSFIGEGNAVKLSAGNHWFSGISVTCGPDKVPHT